MSRSYDCSIGTSDLLWTFLHRPCISEIKTRLQPKVRQSELPGRLVHWQTLLLIESLASTDLHSLGWIYCESSVLCENIDSVTLAPPPLKNNGHISGAHHLLHQGPTRIMWKLENEVGVGHEVKKSWWGREARSDEKGREVNGRDKREGRIIWEEKGRGW